MITFRSITNEDFDFLQATLVSSFNADAALSYGPGAEDGPPGYNDGRLVTKLLTDPTLISWLILKDAQPCGFLTFSIGSPNWLHYFCLHADFINQQLGTQAWQAFEAVQTGTWRLETPSSSCRNQHFYEKIGFQKIGQQHYSVDSSSFIYEKKIPSL